MTEEATEETEVTTEMICEECDSDSSCEGCNYEKAKEKTERPDMDITKQYRMFGLQEVDIVLNRAKSGCKLDRKDFLRAITGQRFQAGHLDNLVQALLQEVVHLMDVIAQQQSSIFELMTCVKSMMLTLSRENTMDMTVFQKILKDEVLPELLKSIEKDKKPEEEVSEPTETDKSTQQTVDPAPIQSSSDLTETSVEE